MLIFLTIISVAASAVTLVAAAKHNLNEAAVSGKSGIQSRRRFSPRHESLVRRTTRKAPSKIGNTNASPTKSTPSSRAPKVSHQTTSENCKTGRLNRRGACLSTFNVNEGDSSRQSSSRPGSTGTVPSIQYPPQINAPVVSSSHSGLHLSQPLSRPPSPPSPQRLGRSSSDSSHISIPSPRSRDPNGVYEKSRISHMSPPGNPDWTPSLVRYPAQVHLTGKGRQTIATDYAVGRSTHHEIEWGKEAKIVVADKKALSTTAINHIPTLLSDLKGYTPKQDAIAMGGSITLQSKMQLPRSSAQKEELMSHANNPDANRNPTLSAATGGNAPRKSLRLNRADLASMTDLTHSDSEPKVSQERKLTRLKVSNAPSESRVADPMRFGPATMRLEAAGHQSNDLRVAASSAGSDLPRTWSSKFRDAVRRFQSGNVPAPTTLPADSPGFRIIG